MVEADSTDLRAIGAATQRSRMPSILVIDSDRKHLTWLSRILRRAVADPQTREELGTIPADGEFQLIAINFDSLPPLEQQRLIDSFADGAWVKTRLLLLSQSATPGQFLELLKRSALTNVIATNDAVNIDEFLVTVQKLLLKDIFGIEKYFVWGVDPVHLTISTSRQRDRLLEIIDEYIEKIGIAAGLARNFRLVADEMVSNALYNAPVDADGKPRFATLARTDHVVLEPGESIDVQFCSDGQRLGIAIKDPFGSLTTEQVLRYLSKCFDGLDRTVSESTPGAGLGLYYVFGAVSHFVVNIQPGQRTEMIGLIDVRGSYRDFASKSKSFNIFVADPVPYK